MSPTIFFEELVSYYRSDKWIRKVTMPDWKRLVCRSVYKAPGGLIRTTLVTDTRSSTIQSVMFTGDFFAYPRDLINELEAYLKSCRADPAAVQVRICDFYDCRGRTIPGIAPEDFSAAIQEALQKSVLTKWGIFLDESNRIFPVNGTFEEIIRKPVSVLLLPYCAKSVSCRFRQLPHCARCGGCSVGDAYALGMSLEVISITSFEDLMDALTAMKKRGVKAYVGCCCEPFYIKHRKDFEQSGLPGILIDVNNTTCYELEQMQNAYAGEFEGKTEIDLALLRKVLAVCNVGGEG